MALNPLDFQALALEFPEAVEAPHFEKTSFRVRGKIFATMAPEKAEAVVKLTPLDQPVFVGHGGGAVYPVKEKWGEQGWTAIDLDSADRALVRDMLACAYRTVAPKSLAARLPRE